MPGGIEEVNVLRDIIMKNMKKILLMEIATVSQAKVIDISMDFCLEHNVMFGIILFEENFT